MTTGPEFAALRAAKGVSQKQLADHAKVSVRSVGNWEHLDEMPPKTEARARQALKWAVDGLYGAGRFNDFETRLTDRSTAALVAEAQQILGILAARLAKAEGKP